MSEKANKIKEKIAFCGTRFLTGAGIAAAGLATISPFLGFPSEGLNTTAAALFAASTVINRSAEKLGNKDKPQWLKNVQKKAVMGSLFAFAALTGSSEIVDDRNNIENAANNLHSQVVATGRPDPEVEKQNKLFAQLLESKTVKYEDLVALASKISAKDLTVNAGKETPSANNNLTISIMKSKKENING